MTPTPHVAVERAAWLRALAADPAVKLTALRVGIVIAEHVNSETREAWPSQTTIASILDDDRGNVSRGLAQLVKLGHLEVELVGRSNRYRMRIEKRVSPYTLSEAANRVATPGKRVRSGEESVCSDTRDPCAVAHPILEDIGGIIDGAAPEGASAPFADLSLQSRCYWEVAGPPSGARRLPSEIIQLVTEIFGDESLNDLTLVRLERLDASMSAARGNLARRLRGWRLQLKSDLVRPLPLSGWLNVQRELQGSRSHVA